MAWIAPVTDRMSADPRTTYVDMNRIANNMAEVGGSPVRANYSSKSIVTKSEWDAIVAFCRTIDPFVNSSTTWQNFNRIEAALLSAHTPPTPPATSLYPSNGLVPSDNLVPSNI